MDINFKLILMCCGAYVVLAAIVAYLMADMKEDFDERDSR